MEHDRRIATTIFDVMKTKLLIRRAERLLLRFWSTGGHNNSLFSTVDPPRSPTIVIAFLEMGFWKFWKLLTEFTYEEPQFAGKSFTFRNWRKQFEPAVSLSPKIWGKVCVRALDFGSLSRLQLVGSSAGKLWHSTRLAVGTG